MLTMAVYTPLTATEIRMLLDKFAIGELLNFAPIDAGVQNSSFFVTTTSADDLRRDWVLSVLEEGGKRQIAFTVDLTTLLHNAGLPVPCPIADKTGEPLQVIAGKPALLFPKAVGSHPLVPDIPQCAAIGDFLGRMHGVSARLTGHDQAPTATPNLLATLPLALQHAGWCNSLSAADNALLETQIDRGEHLSAASDDVPSGAIHADLFRDNTFFEGSKLTAVIDFHSARTDWLLWDVAIAVNDWCSDERGIIDIERCAALLQGYVRQRPFVPAEYLIWSDVLSYSACLFWVSRLLAQLRPADNTVLARQKDPKEYRLKLLQRIAFAPSLPQPT